VSQVAGAWRKSGSWAAVPQVLQSAGGPTTELKTGMKRAVRLTRTAAVARVESWARPHLGSRCWSALRFVADQPVVRCHLRSQEGDLRRVPNKIPNATYVSEADSASLRPQRGSPRGRAPIVCPLSPCDRSAEKLQQGHCRLVTRRSSVHSRLR